MSTTRESITLKKNIIIVGNFGAGKTSLLHRFIKKEFSKIYVNTSLDFYSYEMKHKDEILSVFIWDSLGHERFQSMTDTFYKKAEGVVIVFDLTEDKNVNTVNSWIQVITENCKLNIPIIVVGNKRDICTIHETKLKTVSDSICKSHNIVSYVTASARNGENVDELFKKIILSVFENVLSKGDSVNDEQITIQPDKSESNQCCQII